MRLAAGQLPQQPAVDGAEGKFTRARRARARRRHDRAARRSWSRRNKDRAAGRYARASQSLRSWWRRQKSLVRRSCHTMAWWMGSLVARSQITVVSRWLVMPVAATSRAVSPACCSTSRTQAMVSSQMRRASCSTQPGCGKYCGSSRCASARRRPRWSRRMARLLVVPWSIASRAVMGLLELRLRRPRHQLAHHVAGIGAIEQDAADALADRQAQFQSRRHSHAARVRRSNPRPPGRSPAWPRPR